jgi:hypothetical protein
MGLIQKRFVHGDHTELVLGQLNTKIKKEPKGMDKNDHRHLRHNRSRHEAFPIGQYIQTPPLLFTRDCHPLWVGDILRGSPVFLIAGGPSFASVDKTLLRKPGVMTMTINNSIKSFRSNMWVLVDDPTHFLKSAWLDPTIMKFAPLDHTEKFIFDSEKWEEMDIHVGDCPNILFYRRNEYFRAKQFLHESTVNWGCHKDHGGGRSVMFAAIRILFYLGVRDIFLLGVDLKMDEKSKYHFDQERSTGSISGNTKTYGLIQERLEQLKPYFAKHDMNIYNCNPKSELKTFPFIDVEEAVRYSTSRMPEDIENERSEGLYDRQALLKDSKKQEDKAIETYKKAQDALVKYEKENIDKDLSDDDKIKKLQEDANKKSHIMDQKKRNYAHVKRFGKVLPE